MKEFAKIFRKKNEQQLSGLQFTANIVGKDNSELFSKFVKHEIVEMMDDELMEKFVEAAVGDLVSELAIKPDPEYVRTDADKALCEIAKIMAGFLK